MRHVCVHHCPYVWTKIRLFPGVSTFLFTPKKEIFMTGSLYSCKMQVHEPTLVKHFTHPFVVRSELTFILEELMISDKNAFLVKWPTAVVPAMLTVLCLQSFFCTWRQAGDCPKSLPSWAVLFGFLSRFFWLQYLLGLCKVNIAKRVLSLCSSQLKLPVQCRDMAQFFARGCVLCL